MKKPTVSYPTELKQVLSTHIGPVNVVRYNNQTSKYCLSGGADRTIRLWNPSAGKEVKVYKGHGYEVLGLDIAPDNASFASCGGDKAVLIWDVASGTITRRLQGHFGKINVVRYVGGGAGAKDGGGNVLVSGSFDSKVMLWDMRYVVVLLTGTRLAPWVDRFKGSAQARVPIQTLQEARDSITSISIPPSSADGAEIVTGCVDGVVRSYDVRMGKLVSDTIGAPVTSVVVSPTAPKDSVLVASLDSSIRLMDRTNGQMLATFKHDKFVNTAYRSQVAFGYGEEVVLAGDDQGCLWAWNIIDSKSLMEQPEKVHDKVITWVESHPLNGEELLTASADGTIKVWGKKKEE
ncbi:hypothetical protein QFC20_006385 [Naganishia adeliensis]|uniref:Uncharacterized protein n=1 Tax=Naganishia adeliensis TaxID=92952 RepID=A0ACC2VB88_9TREE|nr:hypothetical protein QFC20_006385 [Naganishia adeliensis]